MTTHYHTGRALAITVGIAATGGALAILLADPIATGTWRLDHVLLPVIVAITIAAGHLCGTALRGWRLLPAVGFALIFVIGTALTVYSSVGAQKSGAGARQELAVTSHNDAIAAKRAELDRARLRLSQAETMADREMTGSRCGARCNDWKLRAQEVTARIGQLEGELRGLGPERLAPSKARPFAEALGVLGFEPAKVEKLAATFEPFAYSLLFELAAIVAFGFGFGHRSGAIQTPAQAETLQPVPAAPKRPTPPKGTGRRGRKGDEKVIAFAAAYKARNGRAPSGSEIQAAFPALPKSTAYDYAKRAA
jgi:hypothetical protein